jgi:peptidylprolyl isomerase
MLKRTHLLALTGFAAIMVYTQSCATDDKRTTSSSTRSTESTDGSKIGEATATDLDVLNHSATSVTGVTGVTGVTSAAANKSQDPDVKKLSEAFGHFIGRNLKSPGINFDLEAIITGMRAGAAGNPPPISDKEYEELMTTFQEKAFKEMSETNLKAANEFMAKNAKEADVKEIEAGKLQYKIEQQGTGPEVTDTSTPTINYTGRYVDGTVFGSSEETGGPISIPLKQTIPGFSKGLIGMKEGEKRKIFVHPELGYGTTGQLPPNELLIFDVEVVKADSKGDKDAKDHTASSDDLLQNGSDTLAYEGEPGSYGEEELEEDLSPAQSAASKEINNPDNQLPAPHTPANPD